MDPQSVGWLSIVPPLLAIVLAMVTRQVILSLLAGVWAGWVISAGGNVLTGTAQTIECLINLFGEGWQTKVIIFTMCGLLAALGGVVSASTLGAGDPTTGYYAELDAIAAVVLGGASLSGGVGGIGGTVLGALLIGVLNNGLGLMKVDEFYQLMARGLVILGAVIIDQLTRGRR